MATHRRGIVSGWDSRNNRPKGVTSPADMRLSLASIARSEGIMLETGAAVTSRYGSSMSFGWSAFTAVIASPLGGWLCPRIEADTVKLAVGHSTYDRIDVIWARQWDYQTAGDHPDSEVEVGVSTGTPAASAQAPSVPSGALAIWTIRVPKGVTNSSQIPTSNITQAPWTTPVGGILTASTYEEADFMVRRINASPGNPVYVAIDGAFHSWNGTNWSTANGIHIAANASSAQSIGKKLKASTAHPALFTLTDTQTLCSWDGSRLLRLGGGKKIGGEWKPTVGSKTLNASQTITSVGALVFTLPVAATVVINASTQIISQGSANGVISIHRNNVESDALSAIWWEASTGNAHPWPSCDLEIECDAGQHGFVLGCRVNTGAACRFLYYKMSVHYA